MRAKFSIIIPVYNVEKYLHKCLESILDQTYDDYEIILVDDGSTDSSGKICDEYARKYPNVHVYHQVNKGQASARNAGVRNAHGEYLWFVDSDDVIIKKNALELLEAKTRNQPDVIAFGWKEASDDADFAKATDRFDFDTAVETTQNGAEYLDDALSKYQFYYWYPCIYLYKTSYWMSQKFEFEEGKKFEDVRLTYRTLLKANSVDKIAECFYGYRVGREGSTVTNASMRTLQDGAEVLAKNISDIEADPTLSKDLTRKLTNNFACNYYALLISSTKLPSEQSGAFAKTFEQYLWVTKYGNYLSHKLIRCTISLFGVRTAQKILGLRRVLKHGK